MRYPVKNAFYLRGELVRPREEVELTEEEAEYFAPKDVIGKPVKEKAARSASGKEA